MGEHIEEKERPKEVKNLLPGSILISSAILAGAWLYKTGPQIPSEQKASVPAQAEKAAPSELEEKVLPLEGILLPVSWGNLGLRLGSVGEMKNPAYGGAGNFASTAGWTLSVGGPMEHYSRHKFFDLTLEQQALVEKMSKGIYRPCCGNSTHFPDCTHGIAMLGLLELMASQGVSEEEMWKAALAVNTYWFPDTYLTIAAYKKNKGVLWSDVNPQEILGANYSSAQGYARIAAQVVSPTQGSGGGGCGIDAGGAASPALREQSGCGI